MKKDVIIAYLYTKFDVKQNLINFIKYYKKNKPGCSHKLLICYKLLSIEEICVLRKILKNTKHIEFIDYVKKNDFDFGSYGRIAKKYPKNPIFFSLGHSYPIVNFWLKKIMKNFKRNTILGTSGSNESMLTAFLNKKKYKIIFNLIKHQNYKKNFFPSPNPHIRTTNFLLYGSDFIKFNRNKAYKYKMDAWKTESGKQGLSNFFLKKGYKILVINSDGNYFNTFNFKISETYCFKKQSKALFSDKHSRKYLSLNIKKRKIVSDLVWY